jgi:hypothetical protein
VTVLLLHNFGREEMSGGVLDRRHPPRKGRLGPAAMVRPRPAGATLVSLWDVRTGILGGVAPSNSRLARGCHCTWAAVSFPAGSVSGR